MRLRYLITLWVAYSFMIITAALTLCLVYCFTLFKFTPVLSTVILCGAIVLLTVFFGRYCRLTISRKAGVFGCLLVPPSLLFLISMPAALIFLLNDYRESPSDNHFLALATSAAAFFYVSSLFVYVLPALRIISLGFSEKLSKAFRPTLMILISGALIIISLLFFLIFRSVSGSGIAYHVILLPALALVNLVLSLIAGLEFRVEVRHRILYGTKKLRDEENEDVTETYSGQLRSNVLFQSHYLGIISGNTSYLANEADDNYAVSLIQSAVRDFDIALVAALRLITSNDRFSIAVRKEADNALGNIEKYFSDPVTNRDMIMHTGQSERAARARAMITGNRRPDPNDVTKLFHDTNIDVRRIGLAVAGRFKMVELFDEIIQALSSSETEKEAFLVLRHFGSDINDKLMQTYMQNSGNEKMCIMLARLPGPDTSPEAMSYLKAFIGSGPSIARLNVIKHLIRQGFQISPENRKDITAMSLEQIGNLSGIIAYIMAAREKKYFLLEKALEWEREMNLQLLYSLLSLLYGREVVEMISSYEKSEQPAMVSFAAELLRSVAEEPLKKPLLALVNNTSEEDRLRDLGVFFPVKANLSETLAQQILSTDQNTVGVWAKACVLNKIAEGKLEADKELLISFLFSSRRILQEEGIRALLRYGDEWYGEVKERLSEDVRQKYNAILEGKLPYAALAFYKTRFLTLCFNRIPEERIIYLASRMKYSQTHDDTSNPGTLTWVVPAENDKSGLYSLSVNVLADFIFHYSEYTDIFVDYIDNIDREPVSQILSS